MKPLSALFTILPLLAACSPTVDSTDAHTFQRSAQRMSDSLDNEKRSKLHDAMWALDRDTSSIVPGIARTEEQKLTALRDRLDGLTANEVIQMGEPLLEAYFSKRRKQLKELQAKKAAYEAKVASEGKLLTLLSLSKPTRLRKNSYNAILRINALNGLPYAVSSFNCSATLTVPGRDVPLSGKSIDYKIFGGIQPGETKDLEIEIFDSTWGRTDLPANTQIYIKLNSLTALVGNGTETIHIGRSVYDSEWGIAAEQELKELTEQFSKDSK